MKLVIFRNIGFEKLEHYMRGFGNHYELTGQTLIFRYTDFCYLSSFIYFRDQNFYSFEALEFRDPNV